MPPIATDPVCHIELSEVPCMDGARDARGI
jgi:hypothetical protein